MPRDLCWWHFYESMTWHHLYCVFTCIYSLLIEKDMWSSNLIEKDICDHRNISIKLPCVCVCLSSAHLFILSVRVSSFFSYFFMFMTFSFFLYKKNFCQTVISLRLVRDFNNIVSLLILGPFSQTCTVKADLSV